LRAKNKREKLWSAEAFARKQEERRGEHGALAASVAFFTRY